jgi:hemoglobin-like flavoprotein
MTGEQKVLLRQSFEKLVPLPKRFGLLFYQRLFELDPELRRLFRGDLDRQASMLAEALALGVLQLIDEEKISGHIRQLGARHHRYGVLDGHYDTFGQALLWTFEQRLGAEFTPTVRDAWLEAWEQLAEAMRAAARQAASPRAASESS